MKGYFLLVCGGRDFTNRDHVFSTLDPILFEHPDLVIIQGGAEGADGLAREWAQSRCIPFVTFPADWNRYGKGAGAVRNTKMLKIGEPDAVAAFPGGKGTADMVHQARRSLRTQIQYYPAPLDAP